MGVKFVMMPQMTGHALLQAIREELLTCIRAQLVKVQPQ